MSGITDSIGDYLTRIRNAQMASHKIVEIPASNMKRSLTEILYDQGYISKYVFEETPNHQGVIKIALKYDKATRMGAIREIKRLSRPGLRRYCGADDVPRFKNGLGITIVSTSKGLLTDKAARELKLGGELVCQVC